MNNEQYEVFEKPFREAAQPLLEQLRERLTDMGYGPFTDVHVVDRDIDRGLGFHKEGDALQVLELMLTDGDELGFEGVGLTLTCSVYATGQVWAPGNYTPEVAIRDVGELVRRLQSFDVGAAADSIQEEWEDVRIREHLAQKQNRPTR